MEPKNKRSRYNLRSVQNDTNILNVRYWTRSKVRPLGGIEQLHQPQEENTTAIRKRKPTTKQMVCKLIDINAFCILKIFDGLNLIELATVADTCSRLRKLAHYHFQSKYSHQISNVVDFGKIERNSTELITIPEAAMIFRNFGKYMRSLKIDAWNFKYTNVAINNKLLFLIKEYCTPMLQDLSLKNFYIKPTDTRNFYALFKSIHHLSLSNIMTEEPNKWALKMPLCKSLEFEELEPVVVNEFLERRFPALEKISFRFIYDDWNSNFLKFLRLHPNLRHIAIVDVYLATIDNLRAIGETGLQLETFQFNGVQRMSKSAFLEAIKPFGEMKTLKSFTMNCFYNSVEGLLEDFVINGVPIQYLHLKHAELNDKAISHLLKLKTIKTLIFRNMESPNVDRLFGIASEMMSLNEFQIKCYETISCESLGKLLIRNQQLSTLKIDALEMNIDDKAFKGFVNILKNRPQPNKLNIEFFNQMMKLNVPKKTIETNKQWIAIKPYDQKSTGLLFYDFDTDDEFDSDWDDDSFDDDDDDELDLSMEGEIGFDHLGILRPFLDFD